MTQNRVTRRSALLGAGGLATGVPLLAACGGSGGATQSGVTGHGPLIATSAVPVGSGVIIAARSAVVTQPTSGVFHIFSNICTHRGCPVSNVDGGTINCTCHGSRFSITDGSVVQGPATQPLPETPAKVKGGQVDVAAATSSQS